MWQLPQAWWWVRRFGVVAERHCSHRRSARSGSRHISLANSARRVNHFFLGSQDFWGTRWRPDVAHRSCLAQHLNPTSCNQQCQPTLQSTAQQGVVQSLRNGIDSKAIRMFRDELYQPVKFGLGGDSGHAFSLPVLELRYRVTFIDAQEVLRHIK